MIRECTRAGDALDCYTSKFKFLMLTRTKLKLETLGHAFSTKLNQPTTTP